MRAHEMKCLAVTIAVALLGTPGFAGATSIALDQNLANIESALSSAPVGMYPFGTAAAWSADGGTASSGGCNGSSGNPGASSATGACSGTLMGGSGDSHAAATANLGTGSLSASASTGPITSMGAAAGALMWDTLTFSGVTAGNNTATLSMQLTGSFAGDLGGGLPPAAFGAAGLAVDPVGSSWITNWTLIDSSSPSPTLTLSFAISNGTPTVLAGGLAVDTIWNGNQDTASLDPPWSLILPTGVTASTGYSGDPLGGGTGGTSVPEPGALSLMGLAMMASAAAWSRARASGKDRAACGLRDTRIS